MEKRSPMRVNRVRSWFWWPVRTSHRSKCAATCCTYSLVYSAGVAMGACVRNRLGRKHGSPASNLNPSMPCFACRPLDHVCEISCSESIEVQVRVVSFVRVPIPASQQLRAPSRASGWPDTRRRRASKTF